MLGREHEDSLCVATQILTSSILHAIFPCRNTFKKVGFSDEKKNKKKQSAIAGFSITACLRLFFVYGFVWTNEMC